MDDRLPCIARESGDFGADSTILHHMHSTEENGPPILAGICRGK